MDSQVATQTRKPLWQDFGTGLHKCKYVNVRRPLAPLRGLLVSVMNYALTTYRTAKWSAIMLTSIGMFVLV